MSFQKNGMRLKNVRSKKRACGCEQGFISERFTNVLIQVHATYILPGNVKIVLGLQTLSFQVCLLNVSLGY